MTRFNAMALETHEPGNSRFISNYLRRRDAIDGMQYEAYVNLVLEPTTTIQINTWRYDCDAENSQIFNDCLDRYIQNKLGCHLQWKPANSTGNNHFFLQCYKFKNSRAIKMFDTKLVVIDVFTTFDQ